MNLLFSYTNVIKRWSGFVKLKTMMLWIGYFEMYRLERIEKKKFKDGLRFTHSLRKSFSLHLTQQ